MGDYRQLEILSQPGSWPNSLGCQFFTSLRRCCPDVAQVRTLDGLGVSLADDAEEVTRKPLERAFLEAAARSMAIRFAFSTVRRIVCQCAAVCESPIELAVAFALGIVSLDLLDSVLFDLPAGVSGNADGSTVLRIKPQAQIEQYRVDFLLTLVAYQDSATGVSVRQKQLVLECDGTDFHDCSIEQLARDRRRDRQLQMRGFDVFRYTGAEIWKDCFGVAREAVLFLKSTVEQRISDTERKQPTSSTETVVRRTASGN